VVSIGPVALRLMGGVRELGTRPGRIVGDENGRRTSGKASSPRPTVVARSRDASGPTQTGWPRRCWPRRIGGSPPSWGRRAAGCRLSRGRGQEVACAATQGALS